MAGSEFASGGGISVSWVHFSDDKATHEEVFLKCCFFFGGFSDILSIFLLKLSRVAFFRTQRIHSWCDGFQLAATNGAMDIFSFEAVSFCLSERHGSRV